MARNASVSLSFTLFPSSHCCLLLLLFLPLCVRVCVLICLFRLLLLLFFFSDVFTSHRVCGAQILPCLLLGLLLISVAGDIISEALPLKLFLCVFRVFLFGEVGKREREGTVKLLFFFLKFFSPP
jgi:hypothetical protein